jgi:Fic family protein
VTALEFGVERLKTLPLSLRLVRELHEKLMRGVRGEDATPGEFRRSQNWIGRPGCTLTEASYVVPPPPAELMNLLGRWETFLHEQSLLPLVQAALMHYPGPGSKSPTYNNVLSPPINSSCRQTILIS